MQTFRGIASHWLGLVMLLYFATYMVWYNLILPVEVRFTGNMSLIGSLIFLPHAVRVLSAWLLGPKALFALIPAELLMHQFYASTEYQQDYTFLIPVFSSFSAVFAFELMRLMKLDVYPKMDGITGWRSVMFAGALASVFNSISGAYLKGEAYSPNAVFDVIARHFVGDVIGLLLAILLLIVVFRLISSGLAGLRQGD